MSRYDAENRQEANISENKDREATPMAWALYCTGCGQVYTLLAASEEAAAAQHRAGCERLQENDKAAGIQSRYREAQEDVLALLRSLAGTGTTDPYAAHLCYVLLQRIEGEATT